MKKRIVICCDGTWNEPESAKDGQITPTNVLKMVRAIAPRDGADGTNQVIYYDHGIGTGAVGFLDKHIGGGTGYGISRNIRDCYSFIANNYADGDDIFLFGFSRGAYTVRSLTGLLATVGLLSRNELRFVPKVYEYYHVDPEQRAGSRFYSLVKSLKTSAVPIKFLGVWDTVGALGIPTPVLGKIQTWVGARWERVRVGFHDCNLAENVENAYQALAIDERRGPFKPSVWDKNTGQRHVLQAWFAGVHSNVGGGYSDAGISDAALVWMTNRAMECGLEMSHEYIQARVAPNFHGKLGDSYSGGYKFLELLGVKSHLRAIGEHVKVEVGEMIHESVLERMNTHKDPVYRPENILGRDRAPNLINEGQRQYFRIGERTVPVFRERKWSRKPITGAGAIVPAEDKVREPCTIEDIARDGGARLRTDKALVVGDRLEFECDAIGRCPGEVVWTGNGELGILFVA